MKIIRASDQLPHDVGTVFVTDVPGSWFQLMGRRAYGDLFVGGVIWTRKGHETPSATDLEELTEMGAEIVRGPEAEALLALFDELHGERIWQDALRKGIEPAIARPDSRTQPN